jgi:hypothetical protein
MPGALTDTVNMTDLADMHSIILEQFAGLEERELSDEQFVSFESDGFLIGVPLLDGDQVEVLRSELEILMRPEQASNSLFYEYNSNESPDPSKRLFHALGAWRVSPAFHDLVFFRPLVSVAEQLLGGRVRFWHDQVFVKPARDGAVVAWHQDYSYWTRTVPCAHLTAWIGLDDSDEENGCVHYVPGSQRWPLLPRETLAADMDTVLAYLNEEQRTSFRSIPSILTAGEASFHHPMTLHGSFENRSDRSRRGVVINFMRDDVVSDSDEPLLADVPPIAKGDKIEGKFFPLLSK